MAKKTTVAAPEPEPEGVEVLVGEPGPEIVSLEDGAVVIEAPEESPAHRYCARPNCGLWAEEGGWCAHHRPRREAS